MNELSPRKVEAGALKRWCKEALELSTRRFWLWLAASVLFSLLCTAATLSYLVIVSAVTLIAAGTLGVSYGVMIAAYADRRLSGKAFVRSLRGNHRWRYLAGTLPTLLWRNRGIVLIGLVVVSVLLFTVDPTRVPTSDTPVALLYFTLNLYGLFLHALTANDQPESHIHRFLIVALMGASWEKSAVLSRQGFDLNREAVSMLSLRHSRPALRLVIAVIAVGFLPFGDTLLVILGLVLFPFTAGLLYVSFRDIYLGVAENSPARAEQRRAVPVPTS